MFAYPNSITRSAARKQLGLPDDVAVLAFVGHIARHKNPSGLVSAFRDMADPRARLLVAGTPTDGEADRVRDLSRADARVHFIPRYLEEDELQVFLNAADLVVCPYGDVLNSGTALLALFATRFFQWSERRAWRSGRIEETTGA